MGQPRQTKILTLKDLPEESAIAVEVRTAEPTRDLVALGSYRLSGEPILPLEIHPTVELDAPAAVVEDGESEVAGFFWGERSLLALTNPSTRSVAARLSISGSAVGRASVPLVLGAGEARLVDLTQELELPWGTEGVVRLTHSGPAVLRGQILNLGADWDASGLKDPRHDGHKAYSFPVRLGAGQNTRFKVYNPHDIAIPVSLVVYQSGEQYQAPLRRVEPRQVAVVDLRTLWEESRFDLQGRELPFPLETAQAKLVVEEPDSTRKILALGMLEDDLDATALVFESCPLCPPAVTAASVWNAPIIGFVGSSEQVLVLLVRDDFSTVLTFPDFIFVDNPAVATGGFSQVDLVGFGFTTLTAETEVCLLYTEIPLPDGKSGCGCAFLATLLPTSNVTSLQIEVLSADVAQDRVQVWLQPSGVNGSLRVELTSAAGNHQLLDAVRSGGTTHDITFDVPTLPVRKFENIRASWTVGVDVGVATLSYGIEVLGDYEHTCYNTPSENDFSGSLFTASTTDASTGCPWIDRDFRAPFLEAINTNGSGVDSAGVTMQIESFCPSPPSVYCGGVDFQCVGYRRPAVIRTSCNVAPIPDSTVAVLVNHPILGCGDSVFVEGIGVRRIEDTGSLQDNIQQLDHYRGVGNSRCPSGWLNPVSKTIKLP